MCCTWKYLNSLLSHFLSVQSISSVCLGLKTSKWRPECNSSRFHMQREIIMNFPKLGRVTQRWYLTCAATKQFALAASSGLFSGGYERCGSDQWDLATKGNERNGKKKRKKSRKPGWTASCRVGGGSSNSLTDCSVTQQRNNININTGHWCFPLSPHFHAIFRPLFALAPPGGCAQIGNGGCLRRSCGNFGRIGGPVSAERPSQRRRRFRER